MRLKVMTLLVGMSRLNVMDRLSGCPFWNESSLWMTLLRRTSRLNGMTRPNGMTRLTERRILK